MVNGKAYFMKARTRTHTRFVKDFALAFFVLLFSLFALQAVAAETDKHVDLSIIADKTHVEVHDERLFIFVRQIEGPNENIVVDRFAARTTIPITETHHTGSFGRIHTYL